MKNRPLREKILCLLLILVILISGMYFPRGKADETSTTTATEQLATTAIPSSVKVITDETEKKNLLGNTSENVRRENLLGIASKFSIFAEEDITFTGADTEGRVAAGGSITATTDYEYQIGWKNENDETADIIIGDGPLNNIALTFGADGNGNIIQDDKKVAVSTSATNMNYSDYNELELSKMVASDIVDFDSEFSYLRKLSEYLATQGKEKYDSSIRFAVGNIDSILVNDYIGINVDDVFDREILTRSVLYFYGTNEHINIFNLSGSLEENLVNSIPSMVFDVPEGSYVILNFDDTKFIANFSVNNQYIYYPASEEEIAQVEHTKDQLVYISTGSATYGSNEILKDDNGNYKIFKSIINGEAYNDTTDKLSKKILLNSPNAETIKLTTFPGSILAPNASIVSEEGAYVPGNIICKSYSGNAQIGNLPYDGPISAEEKYTIDIKKIDSITKEKISDAQLEILDLDRNPLYSWNSGDEISIQLEPGEYILIEKTPGENYEQIINKESTFTVKGSIDIDENGNIIASPLITMGAEIKETVLKRNSENWVSNSYEFEDVGDNDSISGTYKTIYFPNGNKTVFNPCWTITEYDSNGNILNTYSFGGPGGNNIFNIKVLENGYEFYTSHEGYTFKINYEKGQTSANIQGVSSPSIPSFVDELKLSNMSTQPTSDNGLIVVGSKHIGYTNIFEIPANVTASGNNITYYKQEKGTDTMLLFITMKINSAGKIEWANFVEQDIYIASKAMEIDNGYIIYGGTYSSWIYISESQSKFKREQIYKDERESIGRYKPILFIIDKNGKINYSKYITDKELQDKYGGTYQKFDSIYIREDKIYANLNNNKVKFTKSNFPTTWNNLYAGLENANTVRKVTFNVDTSEATTLTDKELYVIVAENNGSPYIWKEFLSWTNVKDGDEVETEVPITKEFYPYYAKYDIRNIDIIKFQPHFYRQNLEDSEDTAQEVYDIKVNNIKAHYYIVEDTVTTSYIAQDYVLTNEKADSIIIQNDHIQTDIIVTKTDKDTETPVAGATYGLFNSSNKLITSQVTNENGKVEFLDLLLDKGNYYIKELIAPEGYKLSTEIKNFTVTGTENFEFEVQDEKIKVTIEKVDQDNNPLSGAELKVVNIEGTQIEKWTTTNIPRQLVGLKPGTYKIIETFTPNGYVKEKDVIFTINEFGETNINNQKVDKVTIKNSLVTGTINITKTGEVYSNLSIKDNVLSYANYIFNYTPAELAGVTFKLYAAEDIIQNGTIKYQKDVLISQAVTDNRGIATFNNLPLGNYYAIEEKALDGYKIDKTPITLGLVYLNDATPIVYAAETMNNERIKAKINVDKTIKNSTEKMQGVVFGLYNKNEMYGEIAADTLLSTIITDENGAGTFDIDLPLGEYYVKELETLDGFIKSEEVKTVEFTADNLKNSSISTDAIFSLHFENDYTKLQITKTEINTQKQISGATLQLQDKEGNIIDTWLTDGTPHTIEKLKIGNYILKELVAAPGYVIAEDKEVSVKETSEIQKINMEDDYTKIQISKIELNSNSEEQITGVTLQIFDEQGNELVDENGNAYKWVTQETPKIISKLPAGTYILKEISAAPGYIKADDITFEVLETSEIQKVTMEDDFTKVQISKLDIETKEHISGATLQIVNEQNNLVLDEHGAPYEWITTSKAKTINKLPVGKYKLIETKPANGYIKADDVEFEVTESAEVVKVIMEDDFTKLQVEKIDVEGKPIKGATLQIYDENNNLVEEWETNGETHVINRKLQVGGLYTLVESKIPNGYTKCENIEFLVSETGDIMLIKESVSDNKENNENEQVVEKITMIDNFVTGTIKITKTGEVIKGVNKYNGPEGFEQFDNYEFEYEEGTLSGVVFELYAAEDIVLNGVVKYAKDQLIGEATTNEKGIATFENISLGSYYYIEKSTIDGYKLDKKPVSLILAYESENMPIVYTTTFNNERIKSNIKIRKVDTQTKDLLKNVTFGLYTKEENSLLPADTLLSIIQTNENGEAIFNIDIPTGKYYVKEIKSIDGYVLSDEIQEIEFDNINNQFELTFENDFTKVIIKKLNEQDEYVENAKMQIQDLSGNIVDEWTTTDTYHRIERKLVAGKTYKLIETKAPQGYEVAEPIEFTVNEDGKINLIKMIDIEKLSDSNIPQTGDNLHILFIILLCATACSVVYNFVKLISVDKKNK